jgi:hypothetical protein
VSTIITSVPAHRRVRTPWRLAALLTLLAWPLVLSDPAAPGVAALFLATAMLTALVVRPRVGGALDIALAAIVCLALLLLLPLPPRLAALLRAGGLGNAPTVAPTTPLLLAGGLAVFSTARHVLSRGGLRRLVAGIGGLGVALSAAAVLGLALDAAWTTVATSHVPAWLVMALPTCLSHLLSRTPSEAGRSRGNAQLPRTAALPPGSFAAAPVAAASASAALGLIVAAAHAAALALAIALVPAAYVLLRRRSLSGRARWAAPAIAVVFAAGLADASTGIVQGGAVAATPPFWVQVGTAGAPLALAVLAACAVFVRAATRAMRHERERTRLFIRAGAACGLGAVGVLGLWDAPLASPATTALAAVLAAIVVHERR